MTDTMTDERAQFEAWLLTEPPYHPNITWEQAGGTKGDDRYLSPSTRFAWSAWKASRLQAQQPGAQAVAWSIELADGTVAEIGWMDMRLFEAAKAIGALAKGARYIFAYRIMEQTNDKA